MVGSDTQALLELDPLGIFLQALDCPLYTARQLLKQLLLTLCKAISKSFLPDPDVLLNDPFDIVFVLEVLFDSLPSSTRQVIEKDTQSITALFAKAVFQLFKAEPNGFFTLNDFCTNLITNSLVLVPLLLQVTHGVLQEAQDFALVTFNNIDFEVGTTITNHLLQLI